MGWSGGGGEEGEWRETLPRYVGLRGGLRWWAFEEPDAAAAMFSWAEFACLFVGLLVALHRYKRQFLCSDQVGPDPAPHTLR
jgi:hypothetical protein